MIKVREKISDKTVTYPNKELVPLVGHVGLEEYYEIVREDLPTYNELTHKTVKTIAYTTDIGDLLPIWRVSYAVVALTTQEIADNKAEAQELSAENSYRVNIEDGRALFEKAFRRMYRRFKDDNVSINNVLVLADVKKYMDWNTDAYVALNQGNYYTAETLVLAILSDNQTELDANRALQKMFEWLRDQIQAHIADTYDIK